MPRIKGGPALAGALLATAGASYAWPSGHLALGPVSTAAGGPGSAQAAPADSGLRRNDDAVPSIQGLALLGVSGSASAGLAVLEDGEGAQRVVRVGRPLLPGVTLKAVGLDHAILEQGGRPLRLQLRRYGPSPDDIGGSGIPLGETAGSEADQRLAARALVRELAPVRSGGRISGYALRRVANLPRLREAGFRDGDVIVSVNGSQFDEERMSELVWELNNAAKAEFVYIRNGQRVRSTL